jgi:hypothetical protein
MDSEKDPDSLPSLPSLPAQAGPPTTPDEASALDQSLYGGDEALAEAAPEPTAQSRPWKFNLHASAGAYYDSNIFIAPTNKQSDYVTTVAVGGGLTLGDYTARLNNYLITDYTGTGEFFARHSNQNAFEQNASIEGQLVFAHLTLHGDFEYVDSADGNIDIGARVRSETYTGLGSARYDFSDKTFLLATAQVTISHIDQYVGSNDERGGLSFNFLPDPSVTLGLGVTGGVLNVDDSGSQTYEQLLASVQLAATSKFTLQASAGVEDRQTPTNKGLVTPVFNLSGDYKPFEELDLTLTGYRRVVNSANYIGSDYIATGVTATAQYRLSARFDILLGAGYTNNDYRDVAAGNGISRDDNYFFVRPSIRYTASSYCNVELYYFYRDNRSTVGSSSFDETQAGIAVTFTY